MMKRKHLYYLQIVLIFCLLPVAKGEFSEAEVRPALLRHWTQWEMRFRLLPREPQFKIEVMRSTSHWGLAQPGLLRVNRLLKWSRATDQSRFLHELAHIFLFHHCPSLSSEHLLHEAFAYWLSQDDLRLYSSSAREVSEFILAQRARDYLVSNATNPPDAQIDFAVARLILETRRSESTSLESFFANTLQTCRSQTSDLSELRQDLLVRLSVTEPRAAIAEKVEADRMVPLSLIMDARTGMVLKTEGEVDRPFAVGSILKPVIALLHKQAALTRKKGRGIAWDCGPQKVWTINDALAYSCNGFFLALKEFSGSDFSSARHIMSALSPRMERIAEAWTEPPTVAQWAGLLPGLELSAREVADLYRLLVLPSENIGEALRSTPREGTLAHLPDSPWFVRNRIALKSGTSRHVSGIPLRGWIVAYDSQKNWILVRSEAGRAPTEFLGGVRSQLTDYVDLNFFQGDVQVLGLVPENQIVIECDFPKMRRRLSDWAAGVNWSCMRMPWRVEFPRADGKRIQRPYYGNFLKRRIEIESRAKSANAITAKQARARRGSSLILQTSNLTYTLNVLTYEGPNFRRATLQALAVLIQNNFMSRPHHDSVCDTTHCQVFQTGWSELTLAKRNDLLAAVLAVNHRGVDKKWSPYSLGGAGPWRVLRTRQALALSFAEKPGAIEERLEEFSLDDPFECEKLRTLLRLRSCPDSWELTREGVEFRGRGEGHGLGLDLERADALAAQGLTYQQILTRMMK